jgi:hypothetical protein
MWHAKLEKRGAPGLFIYGKASVGRTSARWHGIATPFPAEGMLRWDSPHLPRARWLPVFTRSQLSSGGFQARGPVLSLWLNQETWGHGRKDSSDHGADASDR